MTRSDPGGSSASDGQKEQIREQAYALIEAVQAGDSAAGEAIDRLVAAAEERGWRDVVRLGLHASAVRALTERDPRLPVIVEQLRVSAENDADVAMVAMALSWRASQAVTGGDPASAPQADADLARATVLLESVPPGREVAAAHVSCAIGYTERRLWELADEHYLNAQLISPATVDPALHGLLMYNRAEVQLRWVCALREVGDRDGLEEHGLLGSLAVTTALPTIIPEQWRHDLLVMAVLLDAVAGRDVRAEAARLRSVADDDGGGPEFDGHLHLAVALSLRAEGDLDGAYRESALAVDAIDVTVYPSEHDLALRIAVELESERAGVATAGLRYAERHASVRWGDRLSALGTMRARLETERRSAEYDQLTRQVRLDPLTGLANRRGLDRYLQTLRTFDLASVAVIAADIDRFKVINDTFGHAAGDRVLSRTADILRSHVRSGDLVARLGGDEFLVVLADADLDVATHRSDAIHAALASTSWDHGSGSGPATVTMSMGLAVGASPDISLLTARADNALYRAKTAGRNRTVSD